MKAMKVTMLVLAAAGTMAATTGFSATAYADRNEFQSPNGDVFCVSSLDKDGAGSVECEGGGAYEVPRPLSCHLSWGDRFSLHEGTAPVSLCHKDTIVPSRISRGPIPDVAALDHGQSLSAGGLTCAGAASGITCIDTSTRLYIHMSAESNELG